MRQPFIVLGAVLAVAAGAEAQEARPFRTGTPVVMVGEISSQPRDLLFRHEKKMQVAVGPNRTDHTLHLRGARLTDTAGREIRTGDLQDKAWVRVEGTLMDDPRRIRITRLRVIGKDWEVFRQSAEWRPGWERGYVQAVAGSREVYPTTRLFIPGTEVVVSGQVSSQPRDIGFAREQKLQVAVGPEKTDYTLHLDQATFQTLAGKPIRLDDVRDRMWVIAHGTVMDDSRRIRVSRLELAGDHPFWGVLFGSGGVRAASDPDPSSKR